MRAGITKARRNEYLRERVQRGLCRNCPNPTREGKTNCQECADKTAVRAPKYNKTPKRRAYARVWQKAKLLENRAIVLAHYGAFCACCGESDDRFLTIDHKNNNGSHDPRCKFPSGQRRTGFHWYSTIINLGFPEDLQILCWNCNHGRAIYGECPHVLPKDSPRTLKTCPRIEDNQQTSLF